MMIIFFKKILKFYINIKEEYARTRANDSKHLPAVILNVFFCEYNRVK